MFLKGVYIHPSKFIIIRNRTQLISNLSQPNMNLLTTAVLVALTVGIVSAIWEAILDALWRPYVLKKKFLKQGIDGPPYSIFTGSANEIKRLYQETSDMVMDINSNDITHSVFPHYHKWSSQYGESFLYWLQTTPRFCITDPELAKQILLNKFGFYVKPKPTPLSTQLGGKGVASVNGEEWVRRRRILNPAFNVDKLKVMIKKMADCTIHVLDEWKKQTIEAKEQCTKIDVSKEFQKLTADIIAHTAFGSSYAQGKEAFHAQQELQHYTLRKLLGIQFPGSLYVPTPLNIQMWKLRRKLIKTLKGIIESRMKANITNSECPFGDDLLGLLIASSENVEADTAVKLNIWEIIDECKTFFIAGHESTATWLTWTIFLLSLHQDWQERLREEVLRECGTEIPDADMLSKLKLVNMVLLEALRLYTPSLDILRETPEDMKLGNLMIPKKTVLVISMTQIHRNKKYWGEDANEFNPLRFRDGISKAAKHPNAFLAFGVGPRVCIGQNFSMLEAKTVLILLLQRFSFTLSPDYKHAPMHNLTVQPKYGLPTLIKPLHP